jgi:hypothetical protein
MSEANEPGIGAGAPASKKGSTAGAIKPFPALGRIGPRGATRRRPFGKNRPRSCPRLASILRD